MTAVGAVQVRDVKPVVDTTPTTITEMLQHAIDKGIAVEALEKLVALHERVSDRQAAQEFNRALSDFQQECPAIRKRSTAQIVTKGGARYSYNYAELDEIAATVNPLLHPRGFSYSWDTEFTEKLMTVFCTLRHVNGHHVTSKFTCPVETPSAMNDQQKNGAARTYGERYSLCQVLGITMTDPDTDAVDPTPITAAQAKKLEGMARMVEVDIPKFLKHLRVNAFAEVLKRDMDAAVRLLEAKDKENKRKAAEAEKAGA